MHAQTPLMVFLFHPSAHEISTATKKTLEPIAAFAGKLNSFDLAANP